MSSSGSEVRASGSAGAAPPEKKRRGYRACLPCRERKMKCDLGDVDSPGAPPCKRCKRERRDCVFAIDASRKFARKGGPAEQLHRSQSNPAVPATSPLSASALRHPAYSAASAHNPTGEGLGYSPPLALVAAAAANAAASTSYAPERPGLAAHRSSGGVRLSGSYSEPSSSLLSRKRSRSDPPPPHHNPSVSPIPGELHVPDLDNLDDEPGDASGEGAGEGGVDERAGEGGAGGSNVLLSSSLHNPSDALRMLAHASVLKAAGGRGSGGGRGGAGWTDWGPVKRGLLSQLEAEELLRIFEGELHPLYPLLSSEVFHSSHMPTLVRQESLLLGTLLTIASRYAAPPVDTPLGSRCASIHKVMAAWVQAEVAFLTGGQLSLRHISSVEALLLLCEWPLVPVRHSDSFERDDEPAHADARAPGDDLAAVLEPSNQYDAQSWSYIGCAVRLAQELGIDNQLNYRYDAIPSEDSWHQERSLRTWIYCFEADRGVSVRLGRSAVVQSHLSSQWWERVCVLASQRFCARGFDHAWAEPMPQGFIATILGTIHERLYPQREITRAILRTGHWESFLRSLALELQHMRKSSESILREGGVASALLSISFNYIQLYGGTIALRSLQERFQRRLASNDLYSVAATLLNLAEGPYVFEAITAATSIVRTTVGFLHPRGFLRRAPVRILQRVLFACTFLFKALAVGCVEHGSQTTLRSIAAAIDALEEASLDRTHLSSGFAALLRRLQRQFGEVLDAGLGVVAGSEAIPDGHGQPSRGMEGAAAGARGVSEAPAEAQAAGPPPPVGFAASAAEAAQNAEIASANHPLGSDLYPLPPGQAGEEYSPFDKFAPDFFASGAEGGAAPAPGVGGLASAGLGVAGGASGAGPGGAPLWGPSHELGAVAKEQDLLLDSLWSASGVAGGAGAGQGSGAVGTGGGFNLVGTLCGDEGFGF